jgi:hypothetical protein
MLSPEMPRTHTELPADSAGSPLISRAAATFVKAELGAPQGELDEAIQFGEYEGHAP